MAFYNPDIDGAGYNPNNTVANDLAERKRQYDEDMKQRLSIADLERQKFEKQFAAQEEQRKLQNQWAAEDRQRAQAQGSTGQDVQERAALYQLWNQKPWDSKGNALNFDAWLKTYFGK